MYKGMKVTALPQKKYSLNNIDDMILAAAQKTVEVFENNEAEYPGGFSKVEYVPPKKD